MAAAGLCVALARPVLLAFRAGPVMADGGMPVAGRTALLDLSLDFLQIVQVAHDARILRLSDSEQPCEILGHGGLERSLPVQFVQCMAGLAGDLLEMAIREFELLEDADQ
ncbi:MAG: hypothetical protein HC814_08295 [Rhodobacteraceae bacterium]|nr:hypothetical protein [Paracoccaceae bacterium]